MKEGDSIFDGFCYRPYNEDWDGWVNEVPGAGDYPAVIQAREVLRLFDDLCAVVKQNWKLRKKLEFEESLRENRKMIRSGEI
jgi:hypothetical protein